MKNARAGSEKASNSGTEAQSAANAARRRSREGAIAANAARWRSSQKKHEPSPSAGALASSASRTTTANVARAGHPNSDAAAVPSTANACPRESVATRREGPNPRCVRVRVRVRAVPALGLSRAVSALSPASPSAPIPPSSSGPSSPSATRISTRPRSMTHRKGTGAPRRDSPSSAKTSPTSAARSRNRARSASSRSRETLPHSSSRSHTLASSAASLRAAHVAAAFSAAAASRRAVSRTRAAAYARSSPSARRVTSRAFWNDERGSAAFLAAFSSAFFLAAARATASAALRASRAFAVASAAPCSGRYAWTHWTVCERESVRGNIFSSPKAREGKRLAVAPEVPSKAASSSSSPTATAAIRFTRSTFVDLWASSRSRSASRTSLASSRQRCTSRWRLVSLFLVSFVEACACMSSRVVDVCARRMSAGSTASKGAILGGSLEAFPGSCVRGIATELTLSDVSCNVNARRFLGSIVARRSRVTSPRVTQSRRSSVSKRIVCASTGVSAPWQRLLDAGCRASGVPRWHSFNGKSASRSAATGSSGNPRGHSGSAASLMSHSPARSYDRTAVRAPTTWLALPPASASAFCASPCSSAPPVRPDPAAQTPIVRALPARRAFRANARVRSSRQTPTVPT